MKKFEFKLESLLNYRSHKELIARQEVSRAVMAVLASEEKIQTLVHRKTATETILEEKVRQGLNAALFNQYSDYLNGLSHGIFQEQEQKRLHEKALAEKREVLKKRSIDKKAMERLREKRKLEYTKAVLLEEQKELDEISSLKTAREITNEME